MAILEFLFALFVAFAPAVTTSAAAGADEAVVGAPARLVRSEANASSAAHRHGRRSHHVGHVIAAEADGGGSLVEVAASGGMTSALSLQEKSGHFGRVEMNFFQGKWPIGTRKDISAQIGFSFIAHANFKITALGRKLNQHGKVLAGTTVTLWGPHKDILAQVIVEPTDLKEDGYVWKELEDAILLQETREYRITQACAKDMADPWWDGFIHDTKIHIHDQTAGSYAEIRHGVSSNNASIDASGYPENDDGLGRRGGMLNFRIWVVPTYDKSRCCSPHGDGMCTQGVAQKGYHTFDECMNLCRYAPKGAPCMGVEFGQKYCATAAKCTCQLVPEGGCGSYTADEQFSYFSIFGPTHTVRLSQKHSGRLEVRHDNTWGNVCKNGFTIKDALVVCRQMHMWNGAVLLPEAMPGAGKGKIWMSEVMCEGGEPEIEECAFAGWGVHSCTHLMDVGVNCTLPDPGPRGPRGPVGMPGPKADAKAKDWNGTVGRTGFRGLTGHHGPRGDGGINQTAGPPGDRLPPVRIFSQHSFTSGVITAPVFALFVMMSIGITWGLYHFAFINFVRDDTPSHKRRTVEDFIESEAAIAAMKDMYGDKYADKKMKNRSKFMAGDAGGGE